MVDTNGMGFGSRFWMHEKYSLSVQGFWLARLFEANSSMNRYSKTYIRTYCNHYKTLHCLLVVQTPLPENIQTFRETNDANQIFNKLYGSSPLIGSNYMMQELKHDLLESSKKLPSIKLFKTIYQLPHAAFSVSNQIAINAAAFSFCHEH